MWRHTKTKGLYETLQPKSQRFPRHRLLGLLLMSVLSLNADLSCADVDLQTQFDLLQNDRIAIMGNGLADRMQHDGWLETYLQARLPARELVVRNLGFTGDELTQRMRSAGFGSPEEWLKRTEASVVFAFFGYNESFRDRDGIEQFKKDLAEFARKIYRQKSSSGAPLRLVLFSPIAYENIGDPLLPPSEELNDRLAGYTHAMAEVATEFDIPFVNLFDGSAEVFRRTKEPLTINGIHLTEAGNHEVAKLIDRGLFGSVGTPSQAMLTKIREAVVEKNSCWFQRYRTTDGYSIFGGRKGTGGSEWTPDNEKVMVREMEVLDAMTANRDQRIWAIAQGSDLVIDDSNTPPLIPVASNMPGPLEDGSYPFLGGEEAIEKMTVADGLAVNLFASEEQFPELQNPVQSAVDTKGRLWVAAWPSYPHWKPKDEMNDKLLILEDTDGDGRADKCKVFADGLHNPTGFEFYNGGVYVAQVPDIWFLKDTDGDDVADVRQRVVSGIDSADTHHSINSFVVGPGGGMYFQEGYFHRTQVETPHGPPVRVADSGLFRYDPISQEFAAHANYQFWNPHGHVFTYWGDDIANDGTTAVPFYVPSIAVRSTYPSKLNDGPAVYAQRTRPCSGTSLLSSSQFPEEYRDRMLVCNVIGVQGVLQYQLDEDGAGLKGTEKEPLILSTDPNFRPVDLEVGADGAVYLLDWQNPLIGHLQHNLRDSNRDHLHGRVYRIRSQEHDLLQDPEIAGQSVDQLVALLTTRDNGIRYRVKIELSHHSAAEVATACQLWIDSLDSTDSQYEHHLLEGLWLHQHHHVVNEKLLKRLLKSTNHQVRAAAAGVLRAWREDVADVNDLITQLVRDEHPRVRLAGVQICSDIDSAQAAELALEAGKLPHGKFLDYAILATTRTLAPFWKQSIAGGKPFDSENPAAISFLLRAGAPAELLLESKQPKLQEGLITQRNVDQEIRLKSLNSLAESRSVAPIELLLELIARLDADGGENLVEVVKLFDRFDSETLRTSEQNFLQLARGGGHSTTRKAALVAIARIDASEDRVWQLASSSNQGLNDFLGSIQGIPKSEIRALFYDRVREVMLEPERFATSAEPANLEQIGLLAVDAMGHLPGHEQQKLEDLISLLGAGRHRANVVKVLGSIPKSAWRQTDAARMLLITIRYLDKVSPGERASGAAFDELQLAIQAAELLPEQEKAASLARLQTFRVQVLNLSTISHRMAYDLEKMIVKAGSPIQLVFDNQDNMPHNFVLSLPGTLAKIGLQSEAEATQPGAMARHYVPQSDEIVVASRLLQAQEQQTLDFQAPTKPGVYPFVCTYPGHWRRMFGAFYVVEDVEQCQQNPAAYLASHSLEVKDELLKYSRPLRKWTFDELKPALDRLADGHSFERGRQLFEIGSCAACHTVKDEQRRFAPDLVKLDSDRKPEDVLRSMVDPSHTIEKNYQMSKLLLDTGKTIVGLVVEETNDEVTLMADPLASCAPVIVAKEEIEESYESKISLMPSGLLDRFSEEEIIELCAYVLSRGDSNASFYKSSEGH